MAKKKKDFNYPNEDAPEKFESDDAPSIKVDIHLGKRNIPIKKAELSAGEIERGGKRRVGEHEGGWPTYTDENYPKELLPDDHDYEPQTPLSFLKGEKRPSFYEHAAGNSKKDNINLPDPEVKPKRKRSVGNY